LPDDSANLQQGYEQHVVCLSVRGDAIAVHSFLSLVIIKFIKNQKWR
jgi:hypothetical protein